MARVFEVQVAIELSCDEDRDEEWVRNTLTETLRAPQLGYLGVSTETEIGRVVPVDAPAPGSHEMLRMIRRATEYGNAELCRAILIGILDRAGALTLTPGELEHGIQARLMGEHVDLDAFKSAFVVQLGSVVDQQVAAVDEEGVVS